MRFLSINQVWAIEPNAARSYLQIYENILARREGGAPQNAVTPRGDVEQIRAFAVDNGVAQINVRGPIVPHADLFSEISGMTSIEGIKTQLVQALGSEEVKSILLSFDSPGGITTGVSDLANFVRAVDKQKPVVGFAEGLCCSAANWIMAGCSERFVSKTGMMGSIGAMMAWTDDRKLKEMVGLEDIEFISSQSPLKNPDALSDEGKAEYQRLVDENAEAFIGDMAALYGVPVATVKSDFGRGGVMVGKSAVKAGLADKVASIDEVLARMGKGKFKQQATGSNRANGRNVMGFFDDMAIKAGWKAPEEENTPDAPVLAGIAQPVQQVQGEVLEARIGMSAEEIVQLRADAEEGRKARAQMEETRAQAFAATHAADYLENGAGEEKSDRAKFVEAAVPLHLKAQRGEAISTDDLAALMSIPKATSTLPIGVLGESDLKGAVAYATDSDKPDPQQSARDAAEEYAARQNKKN